MLKITTKMMGSFVFWKKLKSVPTDGDEGDNIVLSEKTQFIPVPENSVRDSTR